MNIGELIRAVAFTRKGELAEARYQRLPVGPDGGIGGLTADEQAELDDLLNTPGDGCECGHCGCDTPLIDPHRQPGRDV